MARDINVYSNSLQDESSLWKNDPCFKYLKPKYLIIFKSPKYLKIFRHNCERWDSQNIL